MYEDLTKVDSKKLLQEYKMLQGQTYLGSDTSYMIKIQNYREAVEKELLKRLGVIENA